MRARLLPFDAHLYDQIHRDADKRLRSVRLSIDRCRFSYQDPLVAVLHG
jgi:hypothetical protein